MFNITITLDNIEEFQRFVNIIKGKDKVSEKDIKDATEKLNESSNILKDAVERNEG